MQLGSGPCWLRSSRHARLVSTSPIAESEFKIEAGRPMYVEDRTDFMLSNLSSLVRPKPVFPLARALTLMSLDGLISNTRMVSRI